MAYFSSTMLIDIDRVIDISRLVLVMEKIGRQGSLFSLMELTLNKAIYTLDIWQPKHEN